MRKKNNVTKALQKFQLPTLDITNEVQILGSPISKGRNKFGASNRIYSSIEMPDCRNKNYSSLQRSHNASLLQWQPQRPKSPRDMLDYNFFTPSNKELAKASRMS